MTYQIRYADDFAERVSAALSGRWNGTTQTTDWIDAYWTAAATPEPDDPPQAVSLLGNLPVIRWYRRGDTVVGYAHGRRDGCYVVPTAAALRHIAPAFTPSRRS
jgi:hypothetical protein